MPPRWIRHRIIIVPSGCPQRILVVYTLDGSLTAVSEGSPPLALTPLSHMQFRGTLLHLVYVAPDFQMDGGGAVIAARARFMFTNVHYSGV
jgi:hypothetical protein